MQKVIDLLEKHVQWLALALGAFWLLFMVWSYVINPPAKVEIGSETLTAGEVDEYTVANAVRPLEEAMKPKEAPPMQVDPFAERWLARMDWKSVEPIQTQGLIASLPPIPEEQFKDPRLPQQPGPDQRIVGTTPQQGVQQVTAAAAVIPKDIPAPVVSDWRFGRSTIIEPPPIVPIGAPPAAPVIPGQIDKDWITQSFKVSLPAIAAAFQKAGVPPPPPQTGNTAFLKVEMVRQELLPSGQWAKDVTLKPLPPLQPNMIRQPFPAPKAGIHQENAYLNWAVQNTGDIVQPAFYQTVLNMGDMWQRPGEPLQPINAAAFNPQQFLVGPIPPELNAEQRKMVLDARRQAAAQKRLQQQQNRPTRTRPGRGEAPPEMEGMEYAPLDNERPKFLQVRQPYPQRYPAGLPPEMQGMEGEYMEEDMAFEQPMQQQLLGVGTPDVDYPNGAFDPATWATPAVPLVPGQPVPPNQRPQEITVWAHDDTVQPGKTYRYRARYFILNPLFNKPGAAKNPADARVFAIESPFSEWGPAIEVPSLTNFFIANAMLPQNKVRFDVYHWEKGQQHHTQITVGPGDIVAGNNNGVNFATGYTVVDMRPALRGGDPVVYLANNETGSPVVRTPRGDQQHPVNVRLKEIVAEKAKQAQAAAGGVVQPGVVR